MPHNSECKNKKDFSRISVFRTSSNNNFNYSDFHSSAIFPVPCSPSAPPLDFHYFLTTSLGSCIGRVVTLPVHLLTDEARGNKGLPHAVTPNGGSNSPFCVCALLVCLWQFSLAMKLTRTFPKNPDAKFNFS